MYERIRAALQEYAVEEFTHGHVHSSADAAKVRGTKLEEAAKALVFKADGRLIQCVVAGHRKIDTKKLKELLDAKNIALAHPDEVLAATGCTVGSVPPVGNLFTPPMPVYADAELFSRDHLVFSAGSHYHSLRMSSTDWKDFVKPHVVNIGKES